jgi:hypothetical protein
MRAESKELIQRAFAALSSGPSHDVMAQVAEAIRESGDEGALAAFYEAADDIGQRPQPALEELERLACDVGSNFYVMLDSVVEVTNPGWRRQS